MRLKYKYPSDEGYGFRPRSIATIRRPLCGTLSPSSPPEDPYQDGSKVLTRRSGSGRMMVNSQRMTWCRTLTTEQSPNGHIACNLTAYCPRHRGSPTAVLCTDHPSRWLWRCGCKLVFTPNPNPKFGRGNSGARQSLPDLLFCLFQSTYVNCSLYSNVHKSQFLIAQVYGHHGRAAKSAAKLFNSEIW